MTTKYSALDIACVFIDIASSTDENDLTNLKLQKLLYYSQGHRLAKGSELFSDKIEAWDLGPVIKNVYHTFKACGAFPVTIFDTKATSQKVDKETVDYIKDIWSKYSIYSANFLVRKTHAPNTPWQECFVSGMNQIIPNEKMAEYFKQNEF